MLILPIMIGGIAVLLTTVMHDQVSVAAKLADSQDSQTTSASYTRDVQSAANLTTWSAAPSATLCGSGTTMVLGLNWSGGQTMTTYWMVSTTSGGTTTYTLVRRFCTGGSNTPTVSNTVSRGVSSSQAAATITCSANAASCAASTQWIATAGISSAKISITQPVSGFSYQLAAVPLRWTPASGGLAAGGAPPPPPLVLFDTSPGTNVINMNGNNSTLTVNNGAIVVDSSVANSVNISANNASLTSANGFDIYNCNPGTPSGGACTNNALNNSGNNVTVTTPSSVATKYPDPAYPAPTTPGSAGAGCSTAGSVTTCQPGSYTTLPAALASALGGNNASIVFVAGNYSFTPQLNINGNNVNINFGAGNYTLTGGLSVSANNVTMQNTDAGGVTFGIGSAASVNVSANNLTWNIAAPATGPDAGVLLWQAGTHTITLTGNNGALTSFNGIVYAPNATVDLEGNNGPLAVKGILAKDLLIGGNNIPVTIG
jgi:hypothetical protein